MAKREAIQGFRNGRMPRILGKVGLFEEHEVEDAKEDVLEYECCDDEFPTSLEATESPETIRDTLQSQPSVDAPPPPQHCCKQCGEVWQSGHGSEDPHRRKWN